MNEAQSQLDRLGEAMIDYANSTAQQILDEANERKDKILKETDDTISNQKSALAENGRTSDEIEVTKKISHYEFESYRKLLMYRNSLVSSIFDDVIDRIEEYRKKKEYKEFVFKLIEKAKTEKEFNEHTIIFLNENDSAFFDEIAKLFSVKVNTDKNIVYGGAVISYPDENAVIDNSIDSAIEAEKIHFVSHSELSV